MRCQRCGKNSIAFIMSYFNTQMICLDCQEKEQKHPDYEKAQQREFESVKAGFYNFKGIGKPEDL